MAFCTCVCLPDIVDDVMRKETSSLEAMGKV